MPNNLHIKGSRTRVLNSFPTSSMGNEGDIIIAKIQGRGVYLCTKAANTWYVANRLQEARNVENSSIKNLKTNTVTIDRLVNSNINTNKFIVSDSGVLKYRTSGEIVDDLDIPIVDIYYKNAYCSLGQYNNEEDCIANGGEWYYSDNDSYDNVSSSAENELLTIGRSIGNLDAEPTLLYDGSTLEIKYNSNYDDNWQTSAQTNLLKLSYDSSNNAIFNVDSSGDLTLDVSGDIELNADGGDIAFKDASADLAALSSSGLTISNISEIGSDTDKILMSDSGVVKYVTGANLRSYIGAGTSSVAALNDLSDVTYSSGDLTISSLDTIISGALLFDASGDIEFESEGRVQIDKNIDNTSGGIQNALYVDLDRTGSVSTGIDDTTAVNINSRVTGASGGTITNTGLLVTAIGDSGGSSTTNGLKVLANSADTNNGIYISTTDGVGNDFKNVSSADTGDFFSINTSANGATTLATIDDDATAGHLTLDADGNTIVSIGDANESGEAFHITPSGATNRAVSFSGEVGANTKFRMYEAGGDSTTDYLDITVLEHGDTAITTVDGAGSAATLLLDADGAIVIDSVNSAGAVTDGTLFKTSGTTFGSITAHHALSCFTLFEAGGSSTDDYLEIQVDAAGATSINTVDAGGATAHLTLNPDGNVLVSGADLILDATKKVILDGSGGHTSITESLNDYIKFEVGGENLMNIQEKAATSVAQSSKIWSNCPILFKDLGGVADTPTSGYGALYVNADELAFKNDGGTVINGIGKYHYALRVTNFFSSLANVMIPLAGYIAEMTPSSSTGGVNTGTGEYVTLHAPYNGTVERIMFRSEQPQNGDLIFRIYEASDGTELPGTETCQKTTAINIADDTSVTVDFDSVDSGDNIVDKGKAYAIKVTTPSAMYDVFITVVFKWDTTS